MNCKLSRKLYYDHDMQHHVLRILEREFYLTDMCGATHSHIDLAAKDTQTLRAGPFEKLTNTLCKSQRLRSVPE